MLPSATIFTLSDGGTVWSSSPNASAGSSTSSPRRATSGAIPRRSARSATRSACTPLRASTRSSRRSREGLPDEGSDEAARDPCAQRRARQHLRAANLVEVPLVGRIAAGGPILAEQNVEDTMALPRDLVGSGTLFALTVRATR